MALVTQTLHLHATENMDGSVSFALMQFDMSEYGHMYIGQHDVTFEVPEDFDIKQHKLKALEKEMTRVRADFQARITSLQSQYNDLLALEAPKSNVVVDDDIPF